MCVDVLIELSLQNLEEIYTYRISEEDKAIIKIGSRVLVPFNNRELEGFVLNIHNNTNYSYELKYINKIIDINPILNKELLELGKYIKETYYTRLIDAYQVMLPSGYKAKKSIIVKNKYIYYIETNKSKEELKEYIDNNKRNKREVELLNNLLNTKKELKTKYDSNVVKNLINKDLIFIREERINRLKNDILENNKNIVLTEQQINISNKVKSNLNEFYTYLLYGVTGSGKTEVYIDVIKEVIKNKKQVIMLIPEISLTPQMVNRFSSVFGSDIAILHSALSSGEKYDEYEKILNGEVNIVIGARSAVFAPLKNLGLIIIDEEHTSSYRQDNYPRYNAIDIAKFRTKYNNCPLILGSATPTMDSYARAKKGVYKLLELNKRVGKSVLPDIKLVPMIEEIKKNRPIISELLYNKINDRLNKNEQIILMLNKRGYSSLITCKDCGYTYKCPNCDISLTYHKNKNIMKCHYCDYIKYKDDVCFKCGSKNLSDIGFGTEKVEEIIAKLFDKAKIIRMDNDTTTKKGSHAKIINDFRLEKYNILLGTQMISKGLDFPKVTLVGILNADMGLNIPDFRSSENTFSLLMQTGGRAGRGEEKGEVIIQTYNPDHYVYNYLKTHDYISFYNKEMSIRKTLSYPPYYYIDVIRINSKDYLSAEKESKKIINYLKEKIDSDKIVLGPNPSIMYKLNNIYRFQIIIKYKNNEVLKSIYNFIIDHYRTNKEVNVEVDINPNKV